MSVVDSPVAVQIKKMVWGLNPLPLGEVVLNCIDMNVCMAVYPGHIVCFMVCLGPNLPKCRSETLETDNI